MEELFIDASRKKYRFETRRGSLMVEDLWDLTLQDLDDVAKGLNREIKEAQGEQSFVKPATEASSEAKAKFDIALHVIKTKLAEAEEARSAVEKRARKQKLMELIEAKKDAALSAKSLEELQAEVNAM